MGRRLWGGVTSRDLLITVAAQGLGLIASGVVLANSGSEDWGWGVFLVLIEIVAGFAAGLAARLKASALDRRSLVVALGISVVVYSAVVGLLLLRFLGAVAPEIFTLLVVIGAFFTASGLGGAALGMRPRPSED